MKIEYHKWASPNLNNEMELKIYGQKGKPFLVFPCAGGSFHEFEDFGMVEATRPFIENGLVQFFTVGSMDNQSWLNSSGWASDRAKRHEDYDRYIVKEVVPFIHKQSCESGGIGLYGCSLGGYHALNFLLRHPDLFDASIALSGIYRLSYLIGDYMDNNVYYNSPINFLPNLDESWYLDQIRKASIVVCCGQGAWENESLADTTALKEIFEKKRIPAWVDIWGHDVNHDWPWWRKQLPYFLGHLLEQK